MNQSNIFPLLYEILPEMKTHLSSSTRSTVIRKIVNGFKIRNTLNMSVDILDMVIHHNG